MFCNICGSLGYPNSKGIIQCDNCFEETQTEGEMKSCITITKSTGVRNYEVIREVERPSTSAYCCPNCSARNAVVELRQMDQTDEPEVAFIDCLDCGYGWRE